MLELLRKLGIPERLITDPSFDRILLLKQEIAQLQLQNYLQDDIHKWTWWLTLVVTIASLVIWWKATDRRRFLEVTMFGAMILTMSTFFDVIGYTMNLWAYPDKLLPFLPVLPFDYVLVPLAFMLAYQRYRPWPQYIFASTFVSAVYSFIMEPIVSWLNLAIYVNWRYVYSFPIYIAMAALSRWIVERFLARQVND